MSEKLNIEPRVRSLIHYLNEIENGIVQIPAFQRDYVWTRDDIKDLFDSIKNRYPIGSVLFWKPDMKIGENKDKIGSYYVRNDSKETIYILDGFQRLSTLFGCLTNPDKTKLDRDAKEWEDFFKIYYDLEEETFLYLRPKALNQPYQIPVYILMNSSDFRQYARKEFEKILDEDRIEKYYDRADKLSRIFLEYQIASIDINNANIEEAVEIFSRVNSKGQDISFDWMANALSIKDGFRFGDEIDNLIEELKPYNFEKIDRNVIFRCIQSSFGKLYIDNPDIESLAKRKDFSYVTKQTLPKIKDAVRFLYEDLLVLDSKLVPYNIQLIFIMDFFKRFEHPTADQKSRLKEWFWITTYSNYFTIYSLANQRRAYEYFQKFLDGKEANPTFNDNPTLKFSVAAFPEKINLGSVRAKALTLFLLNYSNDFKVLSADEVRGYKLQKIFSQYNTAENFIPVIEYYNSSTLEGISSLYKKRETDLSFIFNSDNFSSYKKYFLTDQMKDFYLKYCLSNDFNHSLIDDILQVRKKIIQFEEQNFIEKLGLEHKPVALNLHWNRIEW